MKDSMRWPLLHISLVFCLLAGLPRVQAQSPATQPANQLAANSPIRGWFKQLADPDPKIRDKAQIALMGIPADDLPKLRQLVIDSQPVSVAQAGALHDIVLQAFLAGDKCQVLDGETDAGGTIGPYFLGLFWPVNDEDQARMGVSVDVRLPGFPAYRLLRKGDMILGIYFDPKAPLQELPNVETHTQGAIHDAIINRPGIQKVVLEVLRDGQQMRVEVKMAPRPLLADGGTPGAINTFDADREDRADAYWHENFAPLLETEIEASNLAEAP